MEKRRFLFILGLGEWKLGKMTNRGFSLAETMLALSIFVVIFLTLIPMTLYLYDNIEKSKKSLHAMISNYDGTIIHNNSPSIINGEFIVDGIKYHWIIKDQTICTSYFEGEKVKSSCVQYKKQ